MIRIETTQRQWLGLFLMLLFAGLLQVVSTYRVLNQTTDEAIHIATGVQLLDTGKYTVELLHPPFARTMLAIGPWLDGAVYSEEDLAAQYAARVLYDGGDPERVITLGRMAVLPFFALLLIVVAAWARRDFGPWVALLAVFLLAFEPSLLAHAGLATTDLIMTAMMMACLLVLLPWLEQPGWPGTITLGIFSALAIMSKYSAIPFLAVCLLVVLACRWWIDPAGGSPGKLFTLNRLAHVALALLVMMLVIWATFGFGWSRGEFSIPVIFTSVHQGILDVLQKNSEGHLAYLFGEWRQHGWWYYFPVALVVKSNLPGLVLFFAGLWWSIRTGVATQNWRLPVPGLLVCAILLYSITSHINIGIRHILIVYPLMAITAACGAYVLWNSSIPYKAGRLVVVGLLLWQASSAMLARPDYLPYFNFLGGAQPQKILNDSNFDWGQDFDRLSAELKSMDISELHLGYMGFAIPRFHDFPVTHELLPGQPVAGWVAVSAFYRAFQGADGGLHWLDPFTPVKRVGKTFDLYYISEEQLQDQTH